MNFSDLIKDAIEMPLMAHVELYEGRGDIYNSARHSYFCPFKQEIAEAARLRNAQFNTQRISS